MTAGGVSVKGGHAVNQDRCVYRVLGDEAVVAVSDGLGSLPFSQYGAEALCSCVQEIFERKLDVDTDDLGGLIQRMWLERLCGRNADDCCATALVCFVRRGVLTAAAVGDGYLCADADGEPLVFFDRKEDSFRNETKCLHSGPMDGDWRVARRPCRRLNGVYLSSDGLTLMDESVEGISSFVRDFLASYRGKQAEEIDREMEDWMARWTGNDDKTAVYIIG